ncbi:MAG: preprotein translocase subunit SecG [Acidobacteria bacterium]|nr:preprotein translocase subunit SecG [Acidobacteriota bacterium]
MNGLLVTLHVLVALLLIGGILLQPGTKGGGLGSAFGGGGANTAFGARGAAPFLAKLTYWLAAGFMITSLAIEMVIVRENRRVSDRLDELSKVKPAPPAAPPAAPSIPPQAPAPAPKK